MGTDYRRSFSSLKDKIHFALPHLTWTPHILGLGAEHVREREETPETWERPLSPVQGHQCPDYSSEMSGYFIVKFV